MLRTDLIGCLLTLLYNAGYLERKVTQLVHAVKEDSVDIQELHTEVTNIHTSLKNDLSELFDYISSK